MSECICCGIEIIGDGTERGDGYYCEECLSHRRYGFGECDCGESDE